MAPKYIILTKEGHVATIMLNRPDLLNAVNEEMANELIEAMGDVSGDEEVRVLVIKGAGDGFCAGGDFDFDRLRRGEVSIEDTKRVWPEARRQVERGILPPKPQKHVILGLQNLDKPTLAVVNGFTAGFGFDLASACDLRIGSSNAKFTIGFTAVGVPPDSGGAWLLPRIVGLGRALQIILLGDTLDAEEAYRIGLLNWLVPAERLEEEAAKIAGRLATGAPIAHRLAKLMVYKGLETDLDTALAFTFATVYIAGDSEDYREGINALAERRLPDFKGR